MSGLLQIKLDTEELYFAGDKVQGELIIPANKLQDTLEVAITLTGRGKVQWTESEGTSGTLSKHLKRRIKEDVYSSEEEYVNSEMVLDGDGANFIVTSEETGSYPFCFTLHKNLPSTFSSSTGIVEYKLVAKLKRFLREQDETVTMPITVDGIYNLNQHKRLCVSREVRSILGLMTGEIGFVLKLPQKSGFVPGEKVSLQVDMVNTGNMEVNSLKTFIEQVTTYYDKQGKSKTELVILVAVTEATAPGVLNSDLDIWIPPVLTIPNVPATKLGGSGRCKIINVEYFVGLKIAVSGISDPICGYIPIIIGNVPLSLRPAKKHQSRLSNARIAGENSCFVL